MKKRNIFISIVFNMLCPGLGFLYIGKLGLSIAFPLGLVFLLAFTSWTKIVFSPTGMIVTAIVMVSIWLGGIIYAGLLTHRDVSQQLKKIQKWYVYLGFYLVFSVGGGFLIEKVRADYFGYETFRLPANSMANTIMSGDFVIADTWIYRSNKPKRGEIVIFRFPNDPAILYSKRVIGLPKDTISIINGKIFVNGYVIEEAYVEKENNQRTSQKGSANYKVPDDAFFVLGDNRDNSNDSRYWGFVPQENLHGRLEFIWFSYEPIDGIRRERIGLVLKKGD